MSLSYGDQVLWSVNVIIRNFDAKTYPCHNELGTLFLGSIPIIHEWAKDLNNKHRDLKVKILYLALKTKLEYL